MKSPTGSAWLWVAGVVWGGIVLGIAVYSVFLPERHNLYHEYYAPAARNWSAGQDLYKDATTNYRYSPLFAAALAPLTALPEGWGSAVWKVFNCGFFALALVAAGRRLLPRPLGGGGLAALMLLSLPLSAHSMYNGQANLVLLGGVLLGLAAAADGRWNRAALWLGLATLVKGYPLALAMVLTVLYPRRFPLRYLAALGLGLLLPFALQAPPVAAAQTLSWVTHLAESTGLVRERLRSLDHLFAVYGGGLDGRTFLALEAVTGAGVLALSLWQARQTADPRVLLTRVYLLFAAWVVLFGPATESCTYAVAAPAVAWAVVEAFGRPGRWATRVLLVASLLLMGPLVSDLPGPVIRAFATAHGSQPIGALLFLLHVLSQTRWKAAVEASAAPAGRRAA